MMLNIEHLSIVFHDREEPFTAVENFNLQMDHGEIVGIVGESGSGKSMTAHAIMGLLRLYAVEVTGKAKFDGADILKMDEKELRCLCHVRWSIQQICLKRRNQNGIGCLELIQYIQILLQSFTVAQQRTTLPCK